MDTDDVVKVLVGGVAAAAVLLHAAHSKDFDCDPLVARDPGCDPRHHGEHPLHQDVTAQASTFDAMTQSPPPTPVSAHDTLQLQWWRGRGSSRRRAGSGVEPS